MNKDALCGDIWELVEVMKKLRAPDGCPWDRKQTHESLMPYIMEECAEFLDAVAEKDDDNMREELGDVLMHIVLHAVMAEERGAFTFAGEKEHAPEKRTSALDGVPMHCPALIQAEKLQKKAAKLGFDWSKQEEILDKIQEELDELREAVCAGDDPHADEELGDLLFAVCNLSRFRRRRSGELLLAAANRKFKLRFQFMEKELAAQGRQISDCNLDELESLWEKAKQNKVAETGETL